MALSRQHDTDRRRRAPRATAAEAMASGPEPTPSALKALAILEGVVYGGAPVSIARLAEALGMAKPTAHRIAVSLERQNFLQREPGTRRFIGGPRLVELSLGTLEASTRQGSRRAVLQALCDETGETCNLGALAGNEVVYLDRVETQWPLSLRFRPGSRVPIHCTAIGKLLLAGMPRRRQERMIRQLPLKAHTEATITDPAALRRELDRIREQGFAIDNEEFLAGVVCAAVPVAGPGGRRYGGLAVSAPAARMDADRARGHVPALRRAAEQLAESFAAGASGRREAEAGVRAWG